MGEKYNRALFGNNMVLLTVSQLAENHTSYPSDSVSDNLTKGPEKTDNKTQKL